MDLIERISELRILISRLESRYPELSELSSLINDIITKCVSLSDVVLSIYSIADSATHAIIFENNAAPTNLNSSLIRKYLDVVRSSEDLDEAIAKVPQQERQLLIDAIRILRKRGALDIDVAYSDDEGRVKVKIISRVKDGTA